MTQTTTPTVPQNKIWLTILVASLGYFVDIFDLQLFNLIGKKSLGAEGLGLSPADINYYYDYVLFNYQMGGMLIGGILWGILGDKIGRKSILFGSILMYSLANVANGFVTDTTTYAALRLIAGFGLAGELGVAITLVSEIMTKETRGIGTVVIVSTGALGAIASAYISKQCSWQTAYFIGGGLGLLLLLLRFTTFESGMFENMKKSANTEGVRLGDFGALFTNRRRFLKYVYCILMGLPIWYVLGIIIKFAPKIAEAMAVSGSISVADAVMYAYIGLSIGDLICGWLSQIFKNRRQIVLYYLLMTGLCLTILLTARGVSPTLFYLLCFILGITAGYWGLFVTIASEQFGTNLRATVTTTVPNFVRGAVIPITGIYKYYEYGQQAWLGAVILGLTTLGIAVFSIWQLEETFGKDLNYSEV